MLLLTLSSLAPLLLVLAWAALRRVRQQAQAEVRTELAQLTDTLRSTQAHLRRLGEDVFVLRSALGERHLVSDLELARARARLLDPPRQASGEREAPTRQRG